MNMKTPWRVEPHCQEDWISGERYALRSADDGFMIVGADKEVFEHIVACVNALADVENPAAVKELIKTARQVYLGGSLCELSDALAALEVKK